MAKKNRSFNEDNAHVENDAFEKAAGIVSIFSSAEEIAEEQKERERIEEEKEEVVEELENETVVVTQNEEKQEEQDVAEEINSDDKVGDILKKARISKGKSLNDLATFLCIRPRFLQALEENKYDELPGDAYGKGFVRSYAQALGLNAEDILIRYANESTGQSVLDKQNVVVDDQEDGSRPTPKVLILTVVVLFLGVMFIRWTNSVDEVPENVYESQQYSINDNAYVDSSVVPETISVKETEYQEKTEAHENVKKVETAVETKTEAKTEEKTVKEEVKSEVKAEGNVENKEAEVTVEEKVYEPKAYGNRKSHIVIEALDEVWFEVRRRDRTLLFSKTVNKGDTYNVAEYSENLYLKVGNSANVKITLDGEDLPQVGPKGSVRTVSLDPQVLTGKKEMIPLDPEPVQQDAEMDE